MADIEVQVSVEKKTKKVKKTTSSKKKVEEVEENSKENVAPPTKNEDKYEQNQTILIKLNI